MAPQFKLSNFPSVVVGARVSKSGNATPQSGDLEGLSAPLNGRGTGIELQIDSVRP
jgi:cytochrome c-type biogenesis protein CcmH